jgi:hypothetical protein
VAQRSASAELRVLTTLDYAESPPFGSGSGDRVIGAFFFRSSTASTRNASSFPFLTFSRHLFYSLPSPISGQAIQYVGRRVV